MIADDELTVSALAPDATDEQLAAWVPIGLVPRLPDGSPDLGRERAIAERVLAVIRDMLGGPPAKEGSAS